MKSLSFAILAISVLTVMLAPNIGHADDLWKGKAKWSGTKHGDNNPSEKEFWKVAKTGTMHDLAYCIDVMKCKENDINMNKFKEGNAWKTAIEDIKFCIIESEDLGNSLADYEAMRCYMNPEYYEDRS